MADRIIKDTIKDDEKQVIIMSLLDTKYNLHATLFVNGDVLVELPGCFAEDGKHPVCFDNPTWADDSLSNDRAAMFFDERICSQPYMWVDNTDYSKPYGRAYANPVVWFGTKNYHAPEGTDITEYDKYVGKPAFFINALFESSERNAQLHGISENEFDDRVKAYLETDYANFVFNSFLDQSFILDEFEKDGKLDFSNWGHHDNGSLNEMASKFNHEYNEEIKDFVANYCDEDGNTASLEDFELAEELD